MLHLSVNEVMLLLQKGGGKNEEKTFYRSGESYSFFQKERFFWKKKNKGYAASPLVLGQVLPLFQDQTNAEKKKAPPGKRISKEKCPLKKRKKVEKKRRKPKGGGEGCKRERSGEGKSLPTDAKNKFGRKRGLSTKEKNCAIPRENAVSGRKVHDHFHCANGKEVGKAWKKGKGKGGEGTMRRLKGKSQLREQGEGGTILLPSTEASSEEQGIEKGGAVYDSREKGCARGSRHSFKIRL